jgi:hypothetical protein
MAEHLVPLGKRTGGATLTGPDGEQYAWAEDGGVTGVPYEWALELLRVPDAGFFVADAEKAKAAADHVPPGDSGHPDGATVIEPAPGLGVTGRMVTEPAPPAAEAVAEGSQAPESGDGSPVTPKPRGGTRTRK